jgi:hypothetical protein
VCASDRATHTVADALLNGRWIKDIASALDMTALEQYVNLWCSLQDITLSHSPYRFVWKWSADQQYSSRSAYRAFFQGQCGVPGAGVLRKAKATPSSKFFVWLALLDRCWAGDRLLRHQLIDDDTCPPLCSQVEESIHHLLLGCCSTREIWHRFLVRRLLRCCPSPQDRIADWWLSNRKKMLGARGKVLTPWWC